MSRPYAPLLTRSRHRVDDADDRTYYYLLLLTPTTHYYLLLLTPTTHYYLLLVTPTTHYYLLLLTPTTHYYLLLLTRHRVDDADDDVATLRGDEVPRRALEPAVGRVPPSEWLVAPA